ncbi:Coiled-coil domain-containing protein 40 [Taenia crassiceps]|uniref:Coiled-coil domain-containing protein 40 n=1 Tax=Taenia crassiceps TaxID=6207 RepID=A0ABR4Q694_9CEST
MSFSESGDSETLDRDREEQNLSFNEDFNSQLDGIINNSNGVESSPTFDEAANSSSALPECVVDQGSNAEAPEAEDCRENDEEELTVLHPDHPLMKRFQEALKKMLKEHISKADIELREKTEELKCVKNTHLELGSELYNAQQELSKFQSQLQKKHKENLERQARRVKMDEQLAVLHKQFKKTQMDYNLEYKKMIAMREEVDNLALRLFYLNNAKLEVKSDINIMQRAAEKASTELSKAEEEKLHQDMVAHRMQQTVDQLTEDCELLKEQLVAAEEELRSGESVLKDMESQVFGIKTDRKRLMAHWTTSLISLQRRNEAYAELMRDFEKKQDEMTKVTSETEGIKRDITAEQEKHERLTLQLHRTQGDIESAKKELERLQASHEEMRKEYAQTQRILSETERTLENANSIQRDLNQETKLLQKRLEKELIKKHELEDRIDVLLRDKLSATKTSAYVKKMATNVHDQSRELEAQAAVLENTLANDALEVARIRAETKVMEEQAKGLEGEITKRAEDFAALQQKINQANLTVQRKQNHIDALNRKLQHLLKDTGGIELGPLEIMRNHLIKSIAAKQEEIGTLEQQWLREQTELMNRVKEKENLSEELSRQQVCLAVLNRKKLRLDSEINNIEKEKTQLNRDLVQLQNSMVRLNKRIFEQRSSGSALEQENRLAEEDFMRRIREKETQAVEAEAQLEDAVREKEDLLAELLETERHILLWEKRVQLVNETRQAVDSASGLAELRAIRVEIHRMEARKAQIARQQEQLIQALEKSVQKRDSIITRSECAKSVKAKETLTKNTLLREIEDLRSKILDYKKTIGEFDEESERLEAESKRLEGDLEAKYCACEAVRKRSVELTKQLQQLAEYRQKNLIELQMRQHASRYWEQLLAGRYRRICPTRQAARGERERQIGRMRSMLAVVDRLTSEFPMVKHDLSVVRQILTEKLEKEENSEVGESQTDRTE